MISTGRSVHLIQAVLMVALAGLAAAAEAFPPGVVVEEARPGGAAERAGLEPGDVLLSWQRPASLPANPEPAGGELRSPFDLLEVELEQAPRGSVTLQGTRAGASLALTLPAGSWDLLTRPQVSQADLEGYLEARQRVEQGDAPQGIARWRTMAEAWGSEGDHESAAWLLFRIGRVAQSLQQWEEAEEAIQDAVEQAGALSDPLLSAYLKSSLAEIYEAQSEFERAEAAALQALEIRERHGPTSLAVAESLNRLGVMARVRGDLATAESYLRKVLAIREHLAPNSLDVAASLNNLGTVAHVRGDLAAAEDLYRKSLAIRENLAPNSLSIAISLNNLGIVAEMRGDLAAAEDFHRRSLAIRENLAPNSLDIAASLNNLGIVAEKRGDLAAAEDFHRRSVAIRENLAPNSIGMAATLHNLGIVAHDRGDSAVAEDFYRRALAIRNHLAPDSLDVAQSLHRLGILAFARGDLAEAAASLRRAIDTLEAQLGRLGGSAEGQATFRAAHSEIYRDTVRVLIALGRETAHDREAAAFQAEAFQVLERSRARSLLTLLAERDLVFAADLPGEIESERRRLQADYDRTQAELAELSPQEDAEQVEKSLQALRDLQRRSEEMRTEVRRLSPRLAELQYPEPLDLAGAQQALDPGTVAVAYSVGPDETDLFLLTATGRLRIETLPMGEEELREEVARLRCLLERPGLLRGLEPEALELCGLPLEEATPEAAAAAFWAQTEGLYQRLLGPFEAELVPAERLLILPDGPLHRLPFAALVRHPEGEARQYLVEWKPVHTVLSLTLYEQLQRGRTTSDAPAASLAAFGDPVYPQAVSGPASDVADPELRWARARGHRLEPLPASRAEVEAIARLYGADPFTGLKATEERAKAVPRETRYLHFAVHGLLDEAFPLNSALALTLPETLKEGEDNGLLQAWEIFERVRVDAELVTLSACESGLGQELGGEGLIGLTRAFQYAGARSVVASLWNVNDPATAALMERFYGYLKAGRPKDQALRSAQIVLLRGPIEVPGPGGNALPLDASHPFYWAAFQLIGDWR